jgi:hypothetical protein
MTARSEEQPVKPRARTQKRLALTILVVGIAIAFVVSRLERSRPTEEIDGLTTAENSDETGAGDISLGEAAAFEETESNDTPAAVDETPSPPSRMAVESLPPAPNANASKISQKSATPRGPPTETAKPPKSASQQKEKSKAASKQNAKPGPPGGLIEVGKRTYRSPAGLVYAPGSEQGHRYNHVMRHAHDDAQRPVHGVFDGTPDEILTVIDEAFQLAKKGGKNVSTERDGGRTIYLVDLGRRIGYIGGKAGKRQKNPAARHLRLVVEGQKVITAFPDRP